MSLHIQMVPDQDLDIFVMVLCATDGTSQNGSILSRGRREKYWSSCKLIERSPKRHGMCYFFLWLSVWQEIVAKFDLLSEEYGVAQ